MRFLIMFMMSFFHFLSVYPACVQSLYFRMCIHICQIDHIQTLKGKKIEMETERETHTKKSKRTISHTHAYAHKFIHIRHIPVGKEPRDHGLIDVDDDDCFYYYKK